jgi:hypothetical protein
VFGTNTDVAALEYSDYYVIGKDKTFSCESGSITYKPEGDVFPHTRAYWDLGIYELGRNVNDIYVVGGP